MISAECIKAWWPEHPWNSPAMVEQDLVVCRALVAVFSDPFLAENLAFRGGTALHKLYLSPQPRYSEDIDLVQINPGPIRSIMDHLRDALAFLGEPKTKSTPMSNKLLFRFESEMAPVEPLKLKVEINCREHFHVLPWCRLPFAMDNPWFSGACRVTTYELDELLGTKLRALYQRKKGRDLFDLHYALGQAETSAERILQCFCRYMDASAGSIPTHREFTLNMQEKMADPDFTADTGPILLPSISFSPAEAYGILDERLLCHIDRSRKQYSR